MFSTITQQPFCRFGYIFINMSFPISNPAIHPACWLPRLQSLLVTLNFKWLQFSPWWHGEVAGSTSGRVVLDMPPAAGVLLERREGWKGDRRGLEHHASSHVFFLSFFYDYFGDCFLIWGCVAWLIVPSLLLAGLLMVELPCLPELLLSLSSSSPYIVQL